MELVPDLRTFAAIQRKRLDELLTSGIPENGHLEIRRVLHPGKSQTKEQDVAGFSKTYEVPELLLDYQGIEGDRHRRTVRQAKREKTLYPKGELIREHRHVLAVSDYDCQVLSQFMDCEVTPELLGANLVLGRPDNQDCSVSSLFRGMYLQVYPDGEKSFQDRNRLLANLEVYVQQQGCGTTGHTIATEYENKELTKRFVESSKTHRGILCSIEYPVDHQVRISAGQQVKLGLPTGFVE